MAWIGQSWKAGLLALLLALACIPARADPFLSGVRFGQHPDKLRIVLDVSEPVAAHVAMQNHPVRMVVSFSGTGQPGFPPDFGGKGVGPVSSFHPSGEGGLVFELSSPVRVLQNFTLPGEGGKLPRVVLDVVAVPPVPAETEGRMTASAPFAGEAAVPVAGGLPSSASVGDAASGSRESATTRAQPLSGEDAAALSAIIGSLVDTVPVPAKKPVPSSGPDAARDAPPPPPPAPRTRKIIVLDPGHGGRDPGAIGTDGTYEKNITLAVAKELRNQLETSGRYKVLLTRENDRTLRLSDRVKFARQAKADLFVSLHADSIEGGDASGASFYTLSDKASDSATARLVARENRADIIAGLDLSDESEDVAGILIDLAMRETQNQSHLLLRQVVASMTSSGVGLLENPQRSAGFAVLKAPDVPSMLMEMGYLSNRKDVSQLKNPRHQKRLAAALAKGIGEYFSWLEGVSGR